MITQALTAREFYHLNQQYVIQDGKVVIVDEFTGRLMPNRTWRQGLHQAVEAKEGLEPTHPSETLARLSFQQLFGRSARQGDPGSVQAFISVEDELIQRFIPRLIRDNLALAIDKNTPGVKQMAAKTLLMAQYAAQRLAFKQRKNVLRMDTWLEEALSFTGSGSLSI